ncbi:hypothetical protein [Streptomyces albidoflavus]|uniref:hypothetical protein n=1 Tax=Streptomyces albidoflavus TaxID=1886 RepID=UPI00331B9363
MDDMLALFDSPGRMPPAEIQSAQRALTQRQYQLLAAGQHPLTLVLSRPLRLHPEAAPYDDKTADGRRCGNCQFRQKHYGYPKCLVGWDGKSKPTRAAHSTTTDCRAWWPACIDHERKEA